MGDGVGGETARSTRKKGRASVRARPALGCKHCEGGCGRDEGCDGGWSRGEGIKEHA
jgi:hypothetical protein